MDNNQTIKAISEIYWVIGYLRGADLAFDSKRFDRPIEKLAKVIKLLEGGEIEYSYRPCSKHKTKEIDCNICFPVMLLNKEKK